MVCLNRKDDPSWFSLFWDKLSSADSFDFTVATFSVYIVEFLSWKISLTNGRNYILYIVLHDVTDWRPASRLTIKQRALSPHVSHRDHLYLLIPSHLHCLSARVQFSLWLKSLRRDYGYFPPVSREIPVASTTASLVKGLINVAWTLSFVFNGFWLWQGFPLSLVLFVTFMDGVRRVSRLGTSGGLLWIKAPAFPLDPALPLSSAPSEGFQYVCNYEPSNKKSQITEVKFPKNEDDPVSLNTFTSKLEVLLGYWFEEQQFSGGSAGTTTRWLIRKLKEPTRWGWSAAPQQSEQYTLNTTSDSSWRGAGGFILTVNWFTCFILSVPPAGFTWQGSWNHVTMYIHQFSVDFWSQST